MVTTSLQTIQPVLLTTTAMPPIPYTTNPGASSVSLGEILLKLQLVMQVECKVPLSLLENEKSNWSVWEEDLRNYSHIAKQKKKEAEDKLVNLLYSNQHLRKLKCSVSRTCAYTSENDVHDLSKDLKSAQTQLNDLEEKLSAEMHSYERKLKQIEDDILVEKNKLLELQLKIWIGDKQLQNCTTCTKANVTGKGTPLKEKLEEFIKYLGAHEINVNSDILQEKQWKPLHLIAAYGDPTFAEILLDLGADIDAVDESKTTPLMVAAMRNKLPVVQLFIHKNANMLLTDQDEFSALHQAAISGAADIIRELMLQGGLALNTPDYYGFYPLHLAAYYNHTDAVNVLLGNNVPVDSIDQTDSTALHRAAFRGYLQIVEILVAHNADINARNKKNKTPIDLASDANHADVVAFLKNPTSNLIRSQV